MPIINVDIKNKIAVGDGTIVVCENTDYVVKFTFDDEWSPFQAKTMRILFQNGQYYEAVFNGDECPLPQVQNQYRFKLGVYAGELHTTTPAYFECVKTVLSEGGTHEEPTEDIYNQIMDAINSGMLKGVGIASIEKTATQGLVDTYTITYDDGTTTTYEVTNGAKGDKGDRGDVNYTTFTIDPLTGILTANYTTDDSDITFAINGRGHLEVTI